MSQPPPWQYRPGPPSPPPPGSRPPAPHQPAPRVPGPPPGHGYPQPPWPAAAPPGPPGPQARRTDGSQLIIRLLVGIPLTLFGGLILLIIAAVPVLALDDQLSTTVENWWGILIFIGLVTVATVVVRLVRRDWVPLDLPAWALLFTVLPILDGIATTSDSTDAGLGYLLLILLLGVGTLVRLVVFHVFAHRARLRREGAGR